MCGIRSRICCSPEKRKFALVLMVSAKRLRKIFYSTIPSLILVLGVILLYFAMIVQCFTWVEQFRLVRQLLLGLVLVPGEEDRDRPHARPVGAAGDDQLDGVQFHAGSVVGAVTLVSPQTSSGPRQAL